MLPSLKEAAAELQFQPPATWGRNSVRDEVGREDPHLSVLQLTFPPVVLGFCLGDDGNPVAGGEAQVAGLLPCERVGCRDNYLPAGPSHWCPSICNNKNI